MTRRDEEGMTLCILRCYGEKEDGSGVGAYFEDGTPLVLANEESRDFYRLRGQENAEIGFVYPEGINYSVSESDLMAPVVGMGDKSDGIEESKR